MDNVVQNIKLEDIIPRNLQNNDPIEIKELTNSIQQYGVIEPILVRPHNGKYEIILGNKRYQASQLLGLKTIPAFIKNMNDEMVKKILEINRIIVPTSSSNENKFIISDLNQEKQKEKTISIENQNSKNMNLNGSGRILENNQLKFQQKQATDIVNLSELNKNEYERDDNMNNEQLNNNVMNSLGAMSSTTPNPMSEPTFGGRFFPSLEDEPTNMNMGGLDLNTMAVPTNGPVNNLIDLTDLGIENSFPTQPTPSMPNLEPMPSQPNFPSNISEMNNQPMVDIPINIQQNPEPIQENKPKGNVIIIPASAISQKAPELDNNIVNIGNLQNDNPSIEVNPMSMNIPMGGEISPEIPSMNSSLSMPQFDMSQNIAPTNFGQANFNQQQDVNTMVEMNIPQNNFNGPEFNSIPNNPSNEFAMNSPKLNTIESPMVSPIMQEPMTPTYNQNMSSQITSIPMNNNLPPVGKDITPIINTLTNLASNLEAFGYKLNISKEELTNSIKLTIEVEK